VRCTWSLSSWCFPPVCWVAVFGSAPSLRPGRPVSPPLTPIRPCR
jgi:hypothetical protein